MGPKTCMEYDRFSRQGSYRFLVCIKLTLLVYLVFLAGCWQEDERRQSNPLRGPFDDSSRLAIKQRLGYYPLNPDLRGHDNHVQIVGFGFSDDSRYCATIDENGHIAIFETATGHRYATLESRATAIRFGSGKTIVFFDRETRRWKIWEPGRAICHEVKEDARTESPVYFSGIVDRRLMPDSQIFISDGRHLCKIDVGEHSLTTILEWDVVQSRVDELMDRSLLGNGNSLLYGRLKNAEEDLFDEECRIPQVVFSTKGMVALRIEDGVYAFVLWRHGEWQLCFLIAVIVGFDGNAVYYDEKGSGPISCMPIDQLGELLSPENVLSLPRPEVPYFGRDIAVNQIKDNPSIVVQSANRVFDLSPFSRPSTNSKQSSARQGFLRISKLDSGEVVGRIEQPNDVSVQYPYLGTGNVRVGDFAVSPNGQYLAATFDGDVVNLNRTILFDLESWLRTKSGEK